MENSSIRTPLLLIGIFFLTVFIIGYLYYANSTVPPVVEPAPLSTDTEPQQEIVPVTTISTKTDTTFTTRDFLLDEDVELIDEKAQIYLIGSEEGVNGPLYQIFYFRTGGTVRVVLLDPNLSYVRARAETALQARLGLGLLELCAIKAAVMTPRSVSPDLTGEDYSGIELGLPSCPGSIAL